MALADEIRNQIIDYLEEHASFAQLYDWLVDRAPEIAETGDSEARRLSDRVWVLEAEFGYGHRDEPSIRQALVDLLSYVVWQYPEHPASSRPSMGTETRDLYEARPVVAVA